MVKKFPPGTPNCPASVIAIHLATTLGGPMAISETRREVVFSRTSKKNRWSRAGKVAVPCLKKDCPLSGSRCDQLSRSRNEGKRPSYRISKDGVGCRSQSRQTGVKLEDGSCCSCRTSDSGTAAARDYRQHPREKFLVMPPDADDNRRIGTFRNPLALVVPVTVTSSPATRRSARR